MVAIILYTIGALIAFLVIIEDLCEPVFFIIFGKDSFWSSRAFIVCFFAYVFAFPISSLRNFHSMLWAAVGGAATIAFVAFFITWHGVDTWASVGVPRDLAMLRGSVTILLMLPILCFSWSSQIQVVPVYIELEPGHKTLPTMSSIMMWMVVSSAFVYALVGTFGYGSFAEATRGNIMLNYALSDNFASVAKVVTALHVILAYPVTVFPARRSMRVLFTCNQYRVNENDWPLWLRLAFSFVLVTITAIVAILVPSVTIVFGISGAITVVIQFFVPAMLVWQPQPMLEPLAPHTRRQLIEELKLGGHGNLASAPASSAPSASSERAGGDHAPLAVDDADDDQSGGAAEAIGDMSLADEEALVAAETEDAVLKYAQNKKLRRELGWKDGFMSWLQMSLGIVIGVSGIVLNVYELIYGKFLKE